MTTSGVTAPNLTTTHKLPTPSGQLTEAAWCLVRLRKTQAEAQQQQQAMQARLARSSSAGSNGEEHSATQLGSQVGTHHVLNTLFFIGRRWRRLLSHN